GRNGGGPSGRLAGSPASPMSTPGAIPGWLADRLLADITTVLVSEGSQEQVLEAVADALGQIVPYNTLSIYRADSSRRLLGPVLVRDEYLAEIVAFGPIEFGKGIIGDAAENRRPELVNDV